MTTELARSDIRRAWVGGVALAAVLVGAALLGHLLTSRRTPSTAETAEEPRFEITDDLLATAAGEVVLLVEKATGVDLGGVPIRLSSREEVEEALRLDLETGKQTPLLSYIHETTWDEKRNLSGQGYHISGNAYAAPGWAVVSTYGPRKEKTHWNSHTIYLLKLDHDADRKKPVIWRVAHSHAVWDPQMGKHYWAETHATIDRTGRTIVFASNWDAPKEPIEAYRLDLPDGWYEKLMGKRRARGLRSKVAKLLGMSVKELTGE